MSGVDADELLNACSAQGMNTAEDYLMASALVVSDIANIPEELVRSAMLGGKFICEPTYGCAPNASVTKTA